MHPAIAAYNARQTPAYAAVCERLATALNKGLKKAEGKLWYGGPVWLLDGNPIAGYLVRKEHVTLFFWSGQSFHEPGLKRSGPFKAAEVQYTDAAQIKSADVRRWLRKAAVIQWDYRNVINGKGKLKKIGTW